MGLPRGRRWMDMPSRPAPSVAARWAEMKLLALAPSEPVNDPLALREQMHRDAEASTRRQGELRLVVPA